MKKARCAQFCQGRLSKHRTYNFIQKCQIFASTRMLPNSEADTCLQILRF